MDICLHDVEFSFSLAGILFFDMLLVFQWKIVCVVIEIITKDLLQVILFAEPFLVKNTSIGVFNKTMLSSWFFVQLVLHYHQFFGFLYYE